ncbi:MAG: hypothetical protein ACOX88_09725 [Christensenellales bacterium]|jgi:hypothetical protein
MRKNKILAVFLFLALLLTAGCDKSLENGSPEEAVTSFFELLQKGRTKKALDYLSEEERDGFILYSADTMPDAVTGVLSQMQCDIDADATLVDVANRTATVYVNVRSVDLYTIGAQVIQEILPEIYKDAAIGVVWDDEKAMAAIEGRLDEALESGDVPVSQVQIEIHCVHTPDGWFIVPDNALSNAVTGGFFHIFADYV